MATRGATKTERIAEIAKRIENENHRLLDYKFSIPEEYKYLGRILLIVADALLCVADADAPTTEVPGDIKDE